MTGAPIPEGADVVVRFEDVEEAADTIKLSQPLASGANIIPAGDDVVEGEVVASAGTRINAPLIGMLASLGISSVPVYQRVKVAIISTGDELLDPGEKRLPGKIYNSNRYLLEARCKNRSRTRLSRLRSRSRDSCCRISPKSTGSCRSCDHHRAPQLASMMLLRTL